MIAKLSDGRIGNVIRNTTPAGFANGKWVLVAFPVEREPFGFGANKSQMEWVRDSRVVWKLNFK